MTDNDDVLEACGSLFDSSEDDDTRATDNTSSIAVATPLAIDSTVGDDEVRDTNTIDVATSNHTTSDDIDSGDIGGGDEVSNDTKGDDTMNDKNVSELEASTAGTSDDIDSDDVDSDISDSDIYDSVNNFVSSGQDLAEPSLADMIDGSTKNSTVSSPQLFDNEDDTIEDDIFSDDMELPDDIEDDLDYVSDDPDDEFSELHASDDFDEDSIPADVDEDDGLVIHGLDTSGDDESSVDYSDSSPNNILNFPTITRDNTSDNNDSNESDTDTDNTDTDDMVIDDSVTDEDLLRLNDSEFTDADAELGNSSNGVHIPKDASDLDISRLSALQELVAVDPPTLTFNPTFTKGKCAYDCVDWVKKDAKISKYDSDVAVFFQPGVEVPAHWSDTAINIFAQKYCRGQMDSKDREYSVKQVVDRIVDTITTHGLNNGYFDVESAGIFCEELKYLLITQKMAFNSPVWFNIGVKDTPQQASACFILSVDDSIESILKWYHDEATIFKGGSGSGVNLSKIRGSKELLTGGGVASGPVSFMRGADSVAGTIKSGGKTRRAAKMVILNIDHPDVLEFIDVKAREEDKIEILKQAGYDMTLDGRDIVSVQYQNANNSVRISDEFMTAYELGQEWQLRNVLDGTVATTVDARELFSNIAQAAWRCGDPGLQFDGTINKWNTAADTERINGSNPCSEYMHVDNSACNLASLNLLHFIDDSGSFLVEDFVAAVRLTVVAQELLVGYSEYPTAAIRANALAHRQLGVGYTNAAGLLLKLGIAYDSDEGRHILASIAALMTGTGYSTSTDIAACVGSCGAFLSNRVSAIRVLSEHLTATSSLKGSVFTEVVDAAVGAFRHAVDQASIGGLRNMQMSVLAPTGTISLLMDCDTTGIEPLFALQSTKTLVGGGNISLSSSLLAHSLISLGYSASDRETILSHIASTNSVDGCDVLLPEHRSVFATAVGSNSIAPEGHIKMMSAVQPFISGAISKTVNLPESTTPTEIADVYYKAYKLGLKAIAVYRDNCKVFQPLVSGNTTSSSSDNNDTVDSALSSISASSIGVLSGHSPRLFDRTAVRIRLPRCRTSKTTSFSIGDLQGYITVGEFDDGSPGELFLKVAKQGSTIAGVMDLFAIAVSLGLQYGVPLKAFVAKFINTRFEPQGFTDDPDIRICTSIMDLVFKRLAMDYLSEDDRHELGIYGIAERRNMLESHPPAVTTVNIDSDLHDTLLQLGEDLSTGSGSSTQDIIHTFMKILDDANNKNTTGNSTPDSIHSTNLQGSQPTASFNGDAPLCSIDGTPMRKNGACYVCENCGNTSGCS